MLPTKDDSVNVKCSHDGIDVDFDFEKNYGGTIVAKDYSDDKECITKIEKMSDDDKENRTITVRINKDKCGMKRVETNNPKGIQYSVVLNILKNQEVITVQDKAYIIECFYPTGVTNTTLETELNIEGYG